MNVPDDVDVNALAVAMPGQRRNRLRQQLGVRLEGLCRVMSCILNRSNYNTVCQYRVIELTDRRSMLSGASSNELISFSYILG